MSGVDSPVLVIKALGGGYARWTNDDEASRGYRMRSCHRARLCTGDLVFG